MPIKVCDADGKASHENIAKGVIYAVDNGANVINLSLGGIYTEVLANAIKYATERGSVVVMAAGMKPNNYQFENGISMATAYVSGVAALMLNANPCLTPEEIQAIITDTAIT
jgi:subtilisin family serine protease